MNLKKLFIIDAMALAFRSHHAFSHRPLYRSTDSHPTSALYGTALFLIKLIKRENPDYLFVASDTKEKTFRHNLFPSYKANRKSMPEELGQQIPLIYKMFEKFGIKFYSQAGYEADDIIGSITEILQTENIECYIVSGDKDFAQLVSPKNFLYATKNGGVIETLGPREVENKFGCPPKNIVDYLAIMGDSADNVPGVPGIGAKGAEKLLNEFGSLDEIYKNLDKIKNKRQKNALENNKDCAYLSKELVTIYKDLKINVKDHLKNYQDIYQNILNTKTLSDFLKELEFTSLANRITIESHELKKHKKIFVQESARSVKSIKDEQDKRDYLFVDTQEKYEKAITEIQEAKKVSVSLTFTDKSKQQLQAISLSPCAYKAYFIPLIPSEFHSLDISEVTKKLINIFSCTKKSYISSHIKEDMHSLFAIGITLGGCLLDNSILHHTIDSGQIFSEKKAAETMLSIETKSFDGSINQEDLDIAYYYSCEKADLNHRLNLVIVEKLKKANLLSLYKELEEPLIYILWKMEKEGIYVDTKQLDDILFKISKLIETTKNRIFELAGESFNINSSKQLQEIIYNKLKIHKKMGLTHIKKTNSGYSTESSTLNQLNSDPFVQEVLKYKSLTKLTNTYIKPLPEHINSNTQRIHSTFVQTGTATGRLSSVQPNLQNIPIRTDWGKKIRDQFKAKPNHLFISADYSQIELRVLSHLAEDSTMIEAFLQNKDIHTFIATKIFQKDEKHITANERSQAKTINYGIVYGMGAAKLALATGLSSEQAREFIKNFFKKFQNIQIFSQKMQEEAQANGSVSTITGRIRSIPNTDHSEWSSSNIAINTPIQGSASDILKNAMIKINHYLETNNCLCKLVLQIHDELLFECHEDQVVDLVPVIKKIMEQSYLLKVPLIANIGSGKSWLEAHS